MSMDERARHELHEKLTEILGAERTATLMAMLPTDGFQDVTRRADLERVEASLQAQIDQVRADVDALRRETERRFDQMDARFDHLVARPEMDARFHQTGARFDQMDARFDHLVARPEMDARFDRMEALIGEAKGELMAVFRGEINAAVIGQTRVLIFTMAATVAAVAGLALSLARLS
jgi:hypothetical protein